ncbi:hypothetical protein D9M68_837020 [compost metagenome]
MAGAHEHAAFNGLQGEDVAGLHQIVGLCFRGHGGLHGARAVGRRNAGGHTLRGLDRYRERRAFFVTVSHDHGREFELFAALAREREADQAATVARHEVDGFRRHVVGGEHQVALVFTVFLVDEDHDATGAHVGDDVFHQGDGDRRQSFGGVHAEGSLGWVPEALSMRST